MYRMGEEEIEAIGRVIRTGQLFRTGSPEAGHLGEVDRFEEEWAATIGSKYSLLVSGGGTAALVCCLAGLRIGPGDEVIVPGYTWLATATSVLAVGAIPVLCEVDETLALDPDDFERRIGPKTKAVIPVHMGGRPADLERITSIARVHGLKVVEDSCQMVGGSYKGRRTGSWGDAGAFSFNVYKIIGCGEGGGMVTNDRSIYETAFIYHDAGSAFRPRAAELATPIFVAQQYRAHEIMGAMMRVQLTRLDGILTDLRRICRRIESELDGYEGLRVAPSNDREGDCGSVMALQFDGEAAARAFLDAPGTWGYVGIDHGKHVFNNWDTLIEKRIGHHPAMNPFNFRENQGLRANYSADVLPRTLDLLRKTVFMAINPDWPESEIVARVQACKDAAQSRCHAL